MNSFSQRETDPDNKLWTHSSRLTWRKLRSSLKNCSERSARELSASRRPTDKSNKNGFLYWFPNSTCNENSWVETNYLNVIQITYLQSNRSPVKAVCVSLIEYPVQQSLRCQSLSAVPRKGKEKKNTIHIWYSWNENTLWQMGIFFFVGAFFTSLEININHQISIRLSDHFFLSTVRWIRGAI